PDLPPTQISTLSLHDALPISNDPGTRRVSPATSNSPAGPAVAKVDFGRDVQPILRQQCYGCHGPNQQMNGFRLDRRRDAMRGGTDRKSTRLNSSHVSISYAVF